MEVQDALGRATAVLRSRFRDLERIASELFAAWELEIRGRADPLEASGSRRQLNETRTRFHQFTSTVRMVESAADPVLSQLADPLPHLSRPWTPAVAAAVQSGLTALLGDADRWSEQVRESMARADAFLRSMPPEGRMMFWALPARPGAGLDGPGRNRNVRTSTSGIAIPAACCGRTGVACG